MQFEEKKGLMKPGYVVGYLVAYFVFTTVLYFILVLVNKIPESWTYFHVMGITTAIVLVGLALGRLLR